MSTAAHDRLIKLGDTEATVSGADEDIRGRDVVDVDGEDLGTVKDLLIDQAEKRVRFLEVASGGFLGIGADTTFIPVDAITNITGDVVRIRETREKVAGAPVYDPEVVLDRDRHGGILDYYHYGVYWDPKYQYPSYPTYPRPEA